MISGDFVVVVAVVVVFFVALEMRLCLTRAGPEMTDGVCDLCVCCDFRPKSGSMLLYSRKKVRYRRDGYCWKKRKDGKTTREDHMKLKVQGTEVKPPCSPPPPPKNPTDSSCVQ